MGNGLFLKNVFVLDNMIFSFQIFQRDILIDIVYQLTRTGDLLGTEI